MTGDSVPETPGTGRPELDTDAVDTATLSRAFERLYVGAESDLREALNMLDDSERRRLALAAELERLQSRCAVRWADGFGRATRGVRGRLKWRR